MERALYNASKNGYLKMVKYLIKKGAKIDDNILCVASGKGNYNIIKYLFKKVENADLKNYFPLCSASGNGHLNIVKFLILNGVHADSCNNWSLLWSAENNHINVVKYLIEKGADSSVLNYEIKKLGIYTWSKIPEGIEIRKNNECPISKKN